MSMAACGISRPASVSGLDLVIGDQLPGAKGKEIADQEKIDDTVARACETGLYSKKLCRAHTDASYERRQELRADTLIIQ